MNDHRVHEKEKRMVRQGPRASEPMSQSYVWRVLCLLVAVAFVTGCAANQNVVKEERVAPLPEPVVSEPVNTTGSLWPGERSNNMLFADRKARYIDDIITIIIEEESSGENSADTDTSRDSSTTAGIAGITQASPDKRILSKYELGGSSTNSLKGKGSTSRDGKLEGRITARVMEVLANGNLMVQGRRQLTVNAEDQFIVISGIVRPDDISSDNIVSSQYLADARIMYTGKGVVNDKLRPGWLTRVVDWVWPF
jgi:flagellar L-ring protein precursor FlgH